MSLSTIYTCMSLDGLADWVIVLMFVFWYCHKRGREVRLAKEAAEEAGEGEEVEGEGEDEEEDLEDVDEEDYEEEEDDGAERDVNEKAELLRQPDQIGRAHV